MICDFCVLQEGPPLGELGKIFSQFQFLSSKNCSRYDKNFTILNHFC